LFVTVGTTRFDKLVEAVTSKVALEWMKRQGFSSLTIQYGRGIKPPEMISSSSSIIDIQTYDFRPSLIDDMEKADLILSHAGAGTVMEVLRMKNFDYNDNDNDNDNNNKTTTGTTKKLIVVINTELMDNHQTELATAMADRGHI
ncbi:Glyco_tran_28_C-domain-containing protein, partial [Fragilariopsis cylindrus CCMP1102]